MTFITGIFSLHRLGFGFVTPDSSDLTEDIFIPATKTMHALDGDHVEVEVASKRKKNKGPEGRVSKIIARHKKSHMAICVQCLKPGRFIAFLPALGVKKVVFLKGNDKETLIEQGSRLELKVDKWGTPTEPVEAEVVQTIGDIAAASDDNLFAAIEMQIAQHFPKAVLEEVRKFPSHVQKKDMKGRIDFTSDVVITIDPDTAKDYDDALSLRLDEKGNFHLNVHIADVSYYVKPGSALDKEAKKRGNSTYLIGSVLPMLPKELSNELCSLKEGVERLTASVMMVFDSRGNRISHQVSRGVIKSCKRFTYKEALLVLEGKKQSEHAKLLHNFVKLAKLLKGKKKERGCLELELDEVVLKVDDTGEPTGYETIHYDITHQLVEEFMLQANEVIALEVAQRFSHGIFRTHEEPAPENLKEFFRFVGSLGFKVAPGAGEKQLEKVFAISKGTPYEQMVATAYIRCLKLAKYSARNLGHFSLFLDHYCHFTSPIRRYSDLIIHRQLFEGVTYQEDELDTIASHLSKTERNSFKAEQLALLWKKLRLFIKWGEEGKLEYEGALTKIKAKGLLANVAPLHFDYFIDVKTFKKEAMRFDAEKGLLIGARTKQSFQAGMPCRLALKEVDLLTLSTRFKMIPLKKSKKQPAKVKSH